MPRCEFNKGPLCIRRLMEKKSLDEQTEISMWLESGQYVSLDEETARRMVPVVRIQPSLAKRPKNEQLVRDNLPLKYPPEQYSYLISICDAVKRGRKGSYMPDVERQAKCSGNKPLY